MNYGLPHHGTVHEYETIADFLATVPSDSPRSSRNQSWTFGYFDRGPDACRSALLGGHAPARTLERAAQVRDTLEAVVGDLEIMGDSVKSRLVRGYDGDELNVDRYLDGRDDCWLRLKRKRVVSRIIRLGLNVAMSCGTDHSQWENLIGTTGAACEILSKLGYGVEIKAMMITYRSMSPGRDLRDCMGPAWTAKHSGDPVDLEAICSLGRPGLYRWAGIDWINARGVSNGGYCLEPNEAVKQWLGVDCLMTHSWVGQTNGQILEGVRSIIESAQHAAV